LYFIFAALGLRFFSLMPRRYGKDATNGKSEAENTY